MIMEPPLLDRLLQINELFQRDLTRAFDGTGLTPARVHLLWVLTHAGPSTQQSLAVACDVSPRNITGLVDGLEASGHVRRAPHPTDRRAVLVELTESATELMQRMQEEHVELNDTLAAAVAPADRAAFERGLNSVIAKLTALVDEAQAAHDRDQEQAS